MRNATSLVRADSTDITSDEPDAIEAGKALLKKALEVVHEIGSRYLAGVLYGALKKHMAPMAVTCRRIARRSWVGLRRDIGESHRYLGSGSVDFDALFRALGVIGYDGPIVFESFSSAVVDDALSGVLAVWRDLWDDPRELPLTQEGSSATTRMLLKRHACAENAAIATPGYDIDMELGSGGGA